MEFYLMTGAAAYLLYKTIAPRKPISDEAEPQTGVHKMVPAFYKDKWIEKQNREALMPGMRGRTLLRRRRPI